MAVVCELHLRERDQDDAAALAAQVERRIEATGSPPEGLMFLCVHPEPGGFRIMMVFRSAETARAEVEGPLRADASVVDLELGEATMAPVWSMAFPGRA
jgi:hypothetical protein